MRGIAADLLSVGGYRSDESAQVHLDTLATAYSAARDGQLLSVSGAIALDLSLTVSQTAEEVIILIILIILILIIIILLILILLILIIDQLFFPLSEPHFIIT